MNYRQYVQCVRDAPDETGFSLLEMSIVLIIVGLIAGGVFMGRHLLDQASLRATISELRQFDVAMNNFYDKYEALPGDFPSATIVWGRADGGADPTINCANPETDISTTDVLATCNGNGDGRIARGTSAVMNTEVFRFWQHLSNAGMIAGRFSGVGGPVGGSVWRIATIDLNVPMSAMKNGGYYVNSSSLAEGCSSPDWTGIGINDIITSIKAGSQSPQEAGTGGMPWGGLASPEEMRRLDEKFDDGKPGTGLFLASCPDVNCTVGTDTATATYQDNELKSCRFQLKTSRQ